MASPVRLSALERAEGEAPEPQGGGGLLGSVPRIKEEISDAGNKSQQEGGKTGQEIGWSMESWNLYVLVTSSVLRKLDAGRRRHNSWEGRSKHVGRLLSMMGCGPCGVVTVEAGLVQLQVQSLLSSRCVPAVCVSSQTTPRSYRGELRSQQQQKKKKKEGASSPFSVWLARRLLDWFVTLGSRRE